MPGTIKLDVSALSPGDVVYAALSGGADSVCLTSALKDMEPELGISLRACHINHNLRGEESDADERFVREFCEKLSVPLEVFSVDVKSAQQKHESTEECARRLRYDAFDKLICENGAKIATAHNANDNAETVLMNIVRGTGIKGLCGIPAVRGAYVRPLLYCPREDVEAYCKEKKLSFCTDKTNFSAEYTRNKIRLEILPRLVEINPSLTSTVARMTKNVAEDCAFLDRLAQEALKKSACEKGYKCGALAELDGCILSRAVSSLLWDAEIEPSSLRINGICAIIRDGKGKINIEKNKFAVVKKGVFSIETILQKYR